MSGQVDTNVVAMKFDNAQFQSGVAKTLNSLSQLKESLKFNNSTQGLKQLAQAAREVSLDKLQEGVGTIANKFTTLGIIGVTALQNITNQAVAAGQRIVSALTVDPIKLGFQEYETQINAVQTILANTESKGSTLKDVNAALDELNKYADMTIYNFTEMTRNIGTFTAAGVDLDTSVAAIKGIANLAAVSGSTSQQASTAMYQLSQALASGTVKLQDWNSVVNAGMGGQVFQDSLKETARAHGIAIDQMIKDEGSFRETLQKGWLSSEILTETLQKFTGDLTEEQLKSMNYTDEQIQSIMKMGETANDAATKVKTFTQLFDTLQEAAQSGWTQTWEILIGDFEEAKTLLTTISDVISDKLNEQANARNELLQGWKDQGGRQLIIDSLAHGFEVLNQLMVPVKEAMNEMFPPITVEQLMNLTKAVTDFIKNLTVSEEVADKIKNTFSGVFGIFKIGLLVVQDLAGRFGSLLQVLFPLTGNLLDFTSEIGSKISGFAKGLQAAVDKGFSPIEVIGMRINNELKRRFGIDLSPIADFLKQSTSKITGFMKGLIAATEKGFNPLEVIGMRINNELKRRFGADLGAVFENAKNIVSNGVGALTSAFGNLAERLGVRIEPVKNLAKNLWNAIHDLIEKLISSAPSFEEIAAAFDSAFQALRDVINGALEGVNFDQGLDVINTGMLGGLILMIRQFLKQLKGAKNDAKEGGGLLDGIKEMISGLTDSLKAMQATLNATTLLMIAAAVGILATSLIGLSLVDSDKLSTALMAITILFGDLFVSLSAFTKLIEGGAAKGLTTVALGFIGLSVAVLILSAAVKNLADLSWEELAKGLLGVGVVMAELAGFMKLVDGLKFNSASGVGLIALAGAMIVMSYAVERFGSLDVETLAKGLISLSIALAAMSGAMKLLDGMKSGVSIGVGMIAIATAMLILSKAVESFGSIDPESLARGLFSLAASLLAISGSMQLLSGMKNAVGIGVGMIAIATAMLILSQAVSALGNTDPEALMRGLFGLATSMLLITAAVHAMPSDLPAVAASMLLLSSALLVLSGVLGILGSFDEMTIAKAIFALGASLLLLAAATNAMNGAVKGAVALTIVTAALAGLAPVLLILGSMSLEQIGTALIAIAGAIGLFAAAAALLQPLTPAMLGLAGALALFGAACLAVGAGVALLAAGLVLLGGSGVAASAAITAIITTLAGAIPLIITKVGEGLVALITYIGNQSAAIAKAMGQVASAILSTLTSLVPEAGALIRALVKELLNTFNEAIPQVGEVISTLITEILRVLTEAIPQMATAGLQIIQGILEGIASNIGGIVQAGADCIVNFLQGIQENIGRIIDEGIETAVAFINGIADGLRDHKEDIWDALGNLVDAIVEFFVEGVDQLMEIGGDILDGIGEGIVAAVSHIGDFLLGIPGAIAEAITGFDLGQIGADLLGSIFGGGDNGQEEAEDVGSNISSATADGIDANSYLVSNSAADSITDANSAADNETSAFSLVGEHIASGTASGIDSNTYLVENAAKDMIAKAKEAANSAGEIRSPSRLFMRETGQWIPKGVASGITKFTYTVAKASKYMMDEAYDGASKGVAEFNTLFTNIDFGDMSPTIKPVLDLSDIVAGSKSIDKILDKNRDYNISQNAQFGISMPTAISDTRSRAQAIADNMSVKMSNDDVVNAVNKLGSKLDNLPSGNTTIIDGVTYDDGSGINAAVGQLVDAITVGGRM